MSELDLSEELIGRADVIQSTELTAGFMLRNAREAAGLHVAALAVSIKIPVKKLEALESDRLDLLHDSVFVRALAASVCRALKIDPAPVLAKLPTNTMPRLNSDERGINAPFHTPGNNTGLSIGTIFAKPPVLIVFALLVAGAAVFFFPEKIVTEPASEQSLQAPKMADRLEPFTTEQPATRIENSVTSAASMSPGVVDAGGTAVNSSAQPRLTASNSPSSDINRLRTDSAASTSGIVFFKAKAASWVKVVDSNGVVQLSRTLTEGESVSVSGAAPLSIVIGRADVVDVEVRGKVLSLTAFAKENVARFEVK